MKRLFVLLFALPFFSFSQPITDGLIGYWPMNDSPNDLSDNGNDGQILGVTSTEDRFRGTSSAYNFELNQYMLIGDPAEYDFGTNEFSISIWFKKTKEINSGVLLSKWNSGGSPGTNEWTLRTSATAHTKPSFHIEIGNTKYEARSSEDIILNKWYHLLAIRKATSIELWLNGALVASQTIPNAAINNVAGRELNFGRFHNEGSPIYMDGCKMDEAMIFNRALTLTEITQLYNDNPHSDLPSGLIGYWPMGANAFDYSGNGNDGSLVGATAVEDRNRQASAAYQFLEGSYINMGDPEEYDFGADEFSAALWIKRMSPTTGSAEMVVGKWNNTNSPGSNEWILMSNNSNLYFYVEFGTTRYSVTVPGLIEGKWQHVVIQRKIDAIEIYVDGVLSGSTSIPTDVLNNVGRDLLIGKAGGNYLNVHQLDELMLFNKTLSPEEITSLYRLGSPLADKNIPSGLIGYWPMGANAFDYSGNENDGILHGVSPAEGRDREEASAYDFAGNQYISIGDPGEYDFGSEEFSVSVWFNKSASTVYWNGFLLGKWNTGANSGTNEWSLSTTDDGNNDIPSFTVEIGTTAYMVSGSSDVEFDKWYHLVANRKASVIELYLNGILIGNQTIPVGSINNVNGRELKFGRYDNNEVNPIYLNDCKIDEAMIFNKALSHEEITALYRDGSPLANSDLPGGLIGYWPLGKNPLDYSGNGNDGIMNGALIPVQDKDGSESSAYLFRHGRYISIGDQPEYDFGSKEFSISLWFNSEKELSTYARNLLSKWAYAAPPGTNEWDLTISIHYGSNQPRYPVFSVEIGTTTHAITSSQEVEKNRWYHIVAIRKSGSIELYLDGILVANKSIPVGGAINEANRELEFGIKRFHNPPSFHGLDTVSVSEIMIFEKALSPAEIDQLGTNSLIENSPGTSSFANIHEDGADVAIGTTDAHGYKLAVAGNVIAEEVKVSLQDNWPDYVFDAEYELKTLKEIEEFIAENKHLPEIPPASKIESEGIDLGKMNAKLLEKIEELTLYQISLMKQMRGREEHTMELQKQLDAQSSTLLQLQKKLKELQENNKEE